MTELKIVIVEDEPATARNLAHLLQTIDKSLQVSITLASIQESVPWFKANPDAYDLLFMDIRLADGMSFEIFQQVKLTKPVIFVTAYNDYALPAFKNNGIDYILKPFDKQELEKAMNKFRTLTSTIHTADYSQIQDLLNQISQLRKSYKKSFLVHFREKLLPIETLKIAWFYTANEIVYAQLADDRQYIMEFTMEQLEQQIDPFQFFRANRQFIVNRNAITEVGFYFNGRLSLKVKPEPAEKILVSKARAPEFKNWMNS